MGVLQTPALPLGYGARHSRAMKRSRLPGPESSPLFPPLATPDGTPESPLALALPHTTPMPPLPTLRQPDRPHGVLWDLLFGALRAVRRRVHTLRAAVGVVLLAGVALAALGTATFAWVAAHVSAGRTQGWDEAALRLLAGRRIPVLEQIMLEITFLGTA